MNKIKIGLLPLYIKLYDDVMPHLQKRINDFYMTIANEFEKRNVNVVSTSICRIKEEFLYAIRKFEEEQVDAIVTLHLAYSPSLESAEILASTKLSIVVFDTTETYDFSPQQRDEEIMFNHGIHGVQDMCNMLLRSKKDFFIVAGHWKESDIFERALSKLKGIKIASNIRKARVGRIGESFKGMGDFYVPPEKLQESIGIKTIQFDFSKSEQLIGMIKEDEIEAEITNDFTTYEVENIDADVHRNSTRAGLAIRKWIEMEKLSAFTVNFVDMTKDTGFGCMPFLEISKAMARGTGYAGEGDVLTAALMGALTPVYPDTSFVEMFCPDWKNNSIFLSHMGEMNLNLTAEKPRLMVKGVPFTDSFDTTVAYGRFKKGNVVYVNLAPIDNDSYSLIVANGQMLNLQCEDRMKNSIRGWFKPDIPIAEFLEKYSCAGGTHHSVLVYDSDKDSIMTFGKIMGWKICELK